MKLTPCDKPPGVVVSVYTCPACEERGWSHNLIPIGRGFYYCSFCEGWWVEKGKGK